MGAGSHLGNSMGPVCSVQRIANGCAHMHSSTLVLLSSPNPPLRVVTSPFCLATISLPVPCPAQSFLLDLVTQCRTMGMKPPQVPPPIVW